MFLLARTWWRRRSSKGKRSRSFTIRWPLFSRLVHHNSHMILMINVILAKYLDDFQPFCKEISHNLLQNRETLERTCYNLRDEVKELDGKVN